MTKRVPGQFARRPRDSYATPFKAVPPLIPHLDGGDFAEPCCGDGALVRHLESFGLVCCYRGDIQSVQDALLWTPDSAVQMIVTNPPWSWHFLRPLLDHLIATGLPVWALLDADFGHLVRARPFMRQCSHVVSVGRLKWLPGTPHQSLDNAAWYRFHASHNAGTLFIPRMATAA